MKHFIEARQDAIAAMQDERLVPLSSKMCLIFDLKGKCRVLACPVEGEAEDNVRTGVQAVFSAAADVFWDNEVWVDAPETPPGKRALFERVWRDAVADPPGQTRTYTLDRRLSKDSWFGAPFDPPWPQLTQTPPIISFYSFKGGLGRTTTVASLAINAARAGQRVLVLDFDLEAPGLGSLLLPVGGNSSSLGVVDFLLERPVAPPPQSTWRSIARSVMSPR